MIELRAHRLVYSTLVGPIPEGLVLDHLCGVKACVNPAHLEPVTAAENTRRVNGWPNSRKTQCPQGHPYSGENLRVLSDGHRVCKQCNRDAVARYNKGRPR